MIRSAGCVFYCLTFASLKSPSLSLLPLLPFLHFPYDFLNGRPLDRFFPIFCPWEMHMGGDAFKEVGEMRRIVIHVLGNEDGETRREDLKVDREIRSLIAVYIGREGIAFRDGDVRFFDTDDRDEVGAHLETGEELRRLPDGIQPGEVVEEAELDDAFIAILRRDEVAEAAGGVGQHGSDQRGGDLNNSAIFLFNLEVVGSLLVQDLHAFHEVGERSEEGFFFDGDFADCFRNETGGDNVDEVALIDLADIDLRLDCMFEHTDGSLRGARDVESAGEVIDCTERDKTEGGGTFYGYHAIDDFIDRAITAHADDIASFFCSDAGEVCSIPGFFSQLDGDVVIALCQCRMEERDIARGSLASGGRIDDDGASGGFCHGYLLKKVWGIRRCHE